jgi:hypothetical protein
VVRARRLAAFLEFLTGDLRCLGLADLPKQERRVDAVRRRDFGGRAAIFPDDQQFCGQPV